MGLSDFLKGKNQEAEPKEKYWSLRTYNGEIKDPTIEDIEAAVKNANQYGSFFATLIYNNSELEIESVQATSDNKHCRFEALTNDGLVYVQDNLDYDKTFKKFEHFFKYQKIDGYQSWPTEKY